MYSRERSRRHRAQLSDIRQTTPSSGNHGARGDLELSVSAIPGATASTGRPETSISRTSGRAHWEEVNVSTIRERRRPGHELRMEDHGGNASAFLPRPGCNMTGPDAPGSRVRPHRRAVPLPEAMSIAAPPCRLSREPISTAITARVSCAASGWSTAWRPSKPIGRSLDPGGNITSFGEDTAGELYIMTRAGRPVSHRAELSACRLPEPRKKVPDSLPNRFLGVPLEVLHRALVALGRSASGKRAEIAPPTGSRVLAPRVEPVLA